jgi:hypothetical protein
MFYCQRVLFPILVQASMRRGTRVSAVYCEGGGVQSALSTTSSTVFSRCRSFSSYLKRTQSRASPYFFARLFAAARA